LARVVGAESAGARGAYSVDSGHKTPSGSGVVGAMSWAGPPSGMSMEEAALGELPSAIMITPPNGRAVSMDPSLLWDARATELAAKVRRPVPRATED